MQTSLVFTQAETGQVISYIELDQRANQIAYGLLEHFPDSSPYISIMHENTIDYLALTYALKKIARVEVSINRAFRGPALSRMINLTCCDTLFTSQAHFDAIEDVIDDLPHLKKNSSSLMLQMQQ